MCRHPWICITTGFSPLRQLRLGESCHIHWKGTPRFQANGGPDFNHASYSGTQSSCSFHTAYVYCPTDRKRSFDWPSGCESYGCQAHGRRDNSNAYFRRNQNPGHWQDLRSYFALDRQRPKTCFPIRFFEPALGTGAFYSVLLRNFPQDKIISATGVERDQRYANVA
jgi:hypothetical protein